MSEGQQIKNSHFVPRFYLKKFLDKDNCLYFYDLKNKNYHKTTDLRQVCKQKNLYLIKNKITTLDKVLFITTFTNKNPEDIDFCDKMTEMLNGTLANLVSIKYDVKAIQANIDELLSKSLNKEKFSRKQESLFTYIENDFQDLYQNIIDKQALPDSKINDEDIKVYLYIKILKYIHQELFNDIRDAAKKEQESQKELDNTVNENHQDLPKLNLLKTMSSSLPIIDIIYYMLSQYFRTKKIISNLKERTINSSTKISDFIEQNLPNEKFDYNNLIFLFVQIQPILQLNNMMKRNYKLLLIKNHTYTPFLISDNPCINTYAKVNKDKYDLDELEVYFPITPKLALLLTKKSNIDTDIEDVNLIDDFNKKVIQNSERYIFADNEIILKKYISL